MMEGKRRMAHDDELRDIKKGPWKVEEDEVLINHVKKYGPRDWSSIRSKGLLRRTGKSCRLRWVNKLRPDLKTGMKFSADEERTVIDLQAQFGNKWAKIATYLQGRTDNDVKNFWSSRQKRLARILHTSTAPSSSKSHKTTKHLQTPPFDFIPSLKATKLEEEFAASSMETVPFGEVVYPSPISAVPVEQQPYVAFPQFPMLPPDYPPLLEGQDFIGRLGAPSFLDDELGHSALGTAQVPIAPSFQASGTSESHDAVDIDSLIDDDFPPIDLFDQIEPLPSPSHWS
ncbi:transcription factor DUO1 [Salvia miltiorrhiza]|uniref:transcription factor DUO1 n=1 Tax=Salvia miltiorrhiza TaxID=226208 RepID=UPI0025AD2795|nr:transcription factor DUO1 [Salvia miltiorrhiza]